MEPPLAVRTKTESFSPDLFVTGSPTSLGPLLSGDVAVGGGSAGSSGTATETFVFKLHRYTRTRPHLPPPCGH
jgi:hypothetical protein